MNEQAIPPETRASRFLDALPLLAAALLHGLANDRLALALPILLVLIVGLARDLRLTRGPRWSIPGALLGAILGFLSLLLADTPSGPLPPMVLSPLGGLLLGLCTVWSLQGESRRASLGSAFIVAISLQGAPSVPTSLAMLGVALSFVGVALLQAGVFTAGPRTLLRSLLFVVVLAGGGALFSRNLLRAEGLALRIYMELAGEDLVFSGLGSSSFMMVRPTSNVTLRRKPVLELQGEVPERLRGVVLDRFDGEVWTSSESVQALWESPNTLPDHSLTLLPYQAFQEVIPAPTGVTRVDGRVPELTQGALVRGNLQAGSYLLLGMAQPEEPPQTAAPGPQDIELPLELAEALRPLNKEILGNTTLAEAKASAIESHLFRNHLYSLQTDLRGEGHPLVVLVRERRAAYCVYFASAMAAMLRAEGIPARVVGGFVTGAPNPLSGTTIVGEEDAHAWVEAWVAGGWRTFDPTPSREEEPAPGLGATLLSSLRHALLRLRTHPAEVLRDLLLSWPTLTLLAGALLWFAWTRWLRRSPPPMKRGIALMDPRWANYHKRFLHLLSRRHGLRVDPHETDQEILARLKDPRVREAASRFVEAWREVRFAESSVEEGEALLRDALRKLEELG